MSADKSESASLAWREQVLLEHPLVGKIWDARSEQFVGESSLLSELGKTEYLLLGEKHDNKDHHRLQAFLLGYLGEKGKLGSVSLEMFCGEDKERLEVVNNLPGIDEERVLSLLKKNYEQGFELDDYREVFEEAFRAKAVLRPANLSRKEVKHIVHKGTLDAIFSSQEQAQLQLVQDLPLALRSALKKEIKEAHCGYASKELIDKMLNIQRAKDAVMADSMLVSEMSGVKALIAGGGHVRNDYGVPLCLNRRGVNQGVLSIAFIEVEEEKENPKEYYQQVAGHALPYDILWFTPRRELVDYCTKFKSQLLRMGSTEKEAENVAD